MAPDRRVGEGAAPRPGARRTIGFAEIILTRFALERLLYRLSVSPHRDRFILKGADKFWEADPHPRDAVRATRG